MIGVEVDYINIEATVILQNAIDDTLYYRAEVDSPKIAAIVSLNDAQGWTLTEETPRYRANVSTIEISSG